MSDQSCFFEQVVSERLIVPPNFVSGITNHVLLFLNRRLLVCTGKFHEVLVSYKDIKLVQRAGAIVDEQPYVHANIRYTATVFRPTRGAVLVGVVTKLSEDHVACLVHDCFNASIPHPRQKDQTKRNGWHGLSLAVGDYVKFRVTNVEHARGVISIKGALLDDKTSSKTLDKTADDKGTHHRESEMELSDFMAGSPTMGKKLKLKKLTKVKFGIDQEDRSITTNVVHLSEQPEIDESCNEVEQKSKKVKQDQTAGDTESEVVKKASNEVKVRRTKSVWAGIMESSTVHGSDKRIGDCSSEMSMPPFKIPKKKRNAGSDIGLVDISDKGKVVEMETLNGDRPVKKKRSNSVLDTAMIASSSSDAMVDDQPPKKKQKIRHKSK